MLSTACYKASAAPIQAPTIINCALTWPPEPPVITAQLCTDDDLGDQICYTVDDVRELLKFFLVYDRFYTQYMENCPDDR